MHFVLEQHFPAPVEAVEDAYVDPLLIERLGQAPELGRPTVLSMEVDGMIVRTRVRYAFAGRLSPAVTAVLDPARLTWVEEAQLDRATHVSTFAIVPDHYVDRLRCSGTFSLEEEPGGTTLRRTEADIKVRYPLVGGKVERAIVSGLAEHAAREAEVVTRWLLEAPDRGRTAPDG